MFWTRENRYMLVMVDRLVTLTWTTYPPPPHNINLQKLFLVAATIVTCNLLFTVQYAAKWAKEPVGQVRWMFSWWAKWSYPLPDHPTPPPSTRPLFAPATLTDVGTSPLLGGYPQLENPALMETTTSTNKWAGTTFWWM